MFFLKKLNIKKYFYLSVFTIFIFTYHINFAKAIKILATVNSAVITDYDTGEFEKILCLLENSSKNKQNKICNKQDMFSISLMTLIEENLKSEHIKRLELPPDAINKNDFEKYKKEIIGKITPTKTINQDMLDWYIRTEFIWQMIIGSQLHEIKISNEEIKNFANSNNMELNKENERMIENILIQRRASEISQSLMEKMKKFYLIDIKI